MRYRVTIPFPVFVSVEVEADDAESAEDAALDEINITNFVGNGGTNKLVGVTGNASIEAGECHIEGGGYSVDIEEIS